MSTLCALVALFVARILGPSDLWGHTQPRTIAYTADMLVRGGKAWVLARDADGLYATKPPLYNWLAAPGVALLGRGSEFAHRLPSLLVTVVMVLLLVRWGERIGRGVGWLGALAWLAMFPTFKLGYLARPDMLLCLVLFAGWHWGTLILEDARNGRPTALARAAAFWLAFALAAWTKGPVAALLPAYVIVASRLTTGSFAALRRFRPLTLGAIGMSLGALWYAIAAYLSPEHFRETLVYGEVVGRITGNGPEGSHEGPWMILLGSPVNLLYFIARFAPWSVAAILGGIALLAREGSGERRWRGLIAGTNENGAADIGTRLFGGLLWTVVVIAAFSISSGKRADYIAPAYAPAALVAAWWMLGDRFSPVRSRPWLASLAAAATLAIHAAVDRQGTLLMGESMNEIETIVDRCRSERAAVADRPLVVLAPQLPHVTVLCGDPAPCDNTVATLRALLKTHDRALALVGTKGIPEPIRSLLKSGRARELWTIPVPDDASKASITVDVTMFEIDGANR